MLSMDWDAFDGIRKKNPRRRQKHKAIFILRCLPKVLGLAIVVGIVYPSPIFASEMRM